MKESLPPQRPPSRREFLGFMLAAPLLLDCATPRFAEKINPLDKGKIFLIEKYNVTLLEKFKPAEVADLTAVFQTFAERIGDIARFQFKIGKYHFDPDNYIHEHEEGGADEKNNPLNGYAGRGSCDIANENMVMLAPREVLAGHADWMIKKNKVPPVERPKYDLRWTTAHEIAHALGYKLGFGHEFRAAPGQLKNPSSFYTEWSNLSEEIRKLPVENSSTSGVRPPQRPSGYPTLHSSDGEIFADTVAYILTDSHYADHDPWFMKRVALVQKKLADIQTSQPAPVDQENYISNALGESENQ